MRSLFALLSAGVRPFGRQALQRSCLAFAALTLAGVLSSATNANAADNGFSGMEVQGADQPLRMAVGLTEGRGGLIVRDVMPGGPAEQAGFLRGDILTTFDGVNIDSLNQVVAYMQSTKPGQKMTFTRWRNKATSEAPLALSAWPVGWDVRVNAAAVVPRLGVTLVALTSEVRESAGLRWGRTGVLLRSLEADAPAQRWDLEAGDLIVTVGRHPVSNPADVDTLLEQMGEHWFFLIERDNQILLRGPGAQKAIPVASEQVLAAQLSDGPFVMDVTSSAYPSATKSTASYTPGSHLPAMPTPMAAPENQEESLNDVGFSIASITPERRKAMRLRWSSRGVVVTKVAPGSRAALAGLAPGHVIWSINQSAPLTVRETVDALKALVTVAAKSETALTAAFLVEARNGFFLLPFPLREQDTKAQRENNPLARFMDDDGKETGPSQ